jgi:GTP-binding protein Era
MSFRSGFIAIAGPPNVGKSTLLNRIVGAKLAIVSPKPQTTRNRIRGICNGEGFQMVFLDTPGIHETKTALHHSMVESALSAFREVDIVLVMVESAELRKQYLRLILPPLQAARKTSFLLINKIDRSPKKRLLPLMDKYRRTYPFDEIIPISALTGDGLPHLLEILKTRLPPGPRFFPPGTQSDQPESLLAAEIIREKVFHRLSAELPYACAVTVDHMEEKVDRGLLSVAARIHVETDSQKGILIGKQGRMIKTIGRAARVELEGIFGTRVYLDLKVRVEKHWSKDTRALRRLGY